MPQSGFVFSEIHDLYLIDHAGGRSGNVDMWAYTDHFDKLVAEFNTHFDTYCHKRVIIDRLIRCLQKKRYRKNYDEVKLTKFARIERTSLPDVTVTEYEDICDAYWEQGVARDRLPYTRAMTVICKAVPRLSEREVWHFLLSIGKRKRQEGSWRLPLLKKTRMHLNGAWVELSPFVPFRMRRAESRPTVNQLNEIFTVFVRP